MSDFSEEASIVGFLRPRQSAAQMHSTDIAGIFRSTPQSGLPLYWTEGTGPVAITFSTQNAKLLQRKRISDVLLAGLGLFFLLPLLIFVAIAIKCNSRGPVLFRQTRIGYAGIPFEILKFRTLVSEQGDPTGISQTTSDDLRVTRLGRLLRRTSIDELPQLLNVLRGEMSIVGPRPHVPGMMAAGVPYDELVPYYSMRHSVKPGLTGWAQANGYRGPTSDALKARARINHDLAYVQNLGLALDGKIIIMTLLHELLGGGRGI